ncbi:MAG: response regulator [Candidatus Omnitrophica bacterium]|nr:response regulator [Candidatus Omnitrophota bacterium]
MNKKILIIEDDKSMRFLEKKLLESNGYEVIEACDAKEGNKMAIDEQPDLILMDIRLPSKKRGIGAARIIRNQKETSHIPILFVTAYSKGEQTKEVQNIPNCGYITKPFDNSQFLNSIKELIKE